MLLSFAVWRGFPKPWQNNARGAFQLRGRVALRLAVALERVSEGLGMGASLTVLWFYASARCKKNTEVLIIIIMDQSEQPLVTMQERGLEAVILDSGEVWVAEVEVGGDHAGHSRGSREQFTTWF